MTFPSERVDTTRLDPGTFLGPGSFKETTASDSSFSVGQAARVVGVSPSTVRLWEQQGLVRPSRRRSGHRRFTSEDISHLRRVRDAREAQRTAFQEMDEQLRLKRAGARVEVDSGQDGGARRIGTRLRSTRVERGVSLRELAGRAGVSPSYVSAIERGHARPTVAVLQKLTAGLGLTLNSLVDPSVPACTLVRVVDAKMLDIGVSGVRIDNLAPGAKILEPQLFTLAPGAGSGGSYKHEGEEFLYMLEGTLEIWLEGTEHYRLGRGDSLCFSSTRSHRWRNPGKKPAKVIWVNTPPTF